MPDVIDIHPHILSADLQAYPLAPLGGKVSGWASSRPVTAEQLLDHMDAAGVAKAALVQASTAYGYDNAYVLDSTRRFPDRFVAVCCADPLAPGADALVKQWADIPEVGGIRLFTTGSTMADQGGWLNDEATHPFWTAVEATGTPVCVQMRLACLPQLIDVLEAFPAANVVLDHMAYPPIARSHERDAFERLAVLAKYPRLHLKLTVRNTEPLAGCDAARFMELLVEAFGSGRIAWGSNFPAAEQPLSELLDLALSALSTLPESDRENVLAATALRLYPALA